MIVGPRWHLAPEPHDTARHQSYPRSSTSVSHLNITTDSSSASTASELAECRSIAFDTEFVSEQTYRPVLCLVQVHGGRPAGHDRRAGHRGHDALLGGDRRAGARDDRPRRPRRGGVLPPRGRPAARPTCSTCRSPPGWWESSIPAGYGTLISQAAGRSPEQATKPAPTGAAARFRERQIRVRPGRRPLPAADSRHAPRQARRSSGGSSWLDEEMAAWQEEVEQAVDARAMAAASRATRGWTASSLAVVRELWRWREAEAERRDCPVRRVLRDDLIVELARRQTAEPETDPGRPRAGAGRSEAAVARDRRVHPAGPRPAGGGVPRDARTAAACRSLPCWGSFSSRPWAASAAEATLARAWSAPPATSAT